MVTTKLFPPFCYIKSTTIMMTVENWRIEEMTGYKPMTTFYMDFSIADMVGVDAIKDTYNRIFK